MKNTLFTIVAILLTTPVFANESVGKLGFYKGADHSSTAHLMIEGQAAQDLYQHMNLVSEQRDETQGITIRKGKSTECVSFYKDQGAPFRCYLHMDETGQIDSGYAPN